MHSLINAVASCSKLDERSEQDLFYDRLVNNTWPALMTSPRPLVTSRDFEVGVPSTFTFQSLDHLCKQLWLRPSANSFS
jgi:hypothetical protein